MAELETAPRRRRRGRGGAEAGGRRRPARDRQHRVGADPDPARARRRVPADDRSARRRRRQAALPRGRCAQAIAPSRQPGDHDGRDHRDLRHGGMNDEVHVATGLHRDGGGAGTDNCLGTRGRPGPHRVPGAAERGAHRAGPADRGAGSHRARAGQGRRPRRGGCTGGNRWTVPRGEGAAGRLPDRRRRVDGTGDRDRGPGLGGARAGWRSDQAADRGARGDGRAELGGVSRPPGIEDLLRDAAPRVLAAVLRRFGDFADAEDAVQEAMIAATQQWPRQGTPDNPGGWLVHVASRRMLDQARSETARRDREEVAAAREPRDLEPAAGHDDTLALMLMCCHPTLSRASAIALTLRAVGGLTTAEIANAFLVPEATMAQRISRAKQSIKSSAIPFVMPAGGERPERMRAGLHVLYLIFNEGYSATSGPDLQRGELTGEAIRLTRAVHRLLPDDGEVAGLLALMLLTDARRAARTGPDRALIPLAEQDRSRWDREAIEEGAALVTDALSRTPLGPYQLQAAIAAVHAEAARAEDTDWPQIVALYGVLERISPNPIVTLNHAVAVAMVRGPRAGLELLETLDDDDRISRHHRLEAVRAHLLEMAGDRSAALASYRTAARRSTSLPERPYLETRAARLRDARVS